MFSHGYSAALRKAGNRTKGAAASGEAELEHTELLGTAANVSRQGGSSCAALGVAWAISPPAR